MSSSCPLPSEWPYPPSPDLVLSSPAPHLKLRSPGLRAPVSCSPSPSYIFFKRPSSSSPAPPVLCSPSLACSSSLFHEETRSSMPIRARRPPDQWCSPSPSYVFFKRPSSSSPAPQFSALRLSLALPLSSTKKTHSSLLIRARRPLDQWCACPRVGRVEAPGRTVRIPPAFHQLNPRPPMEPRDCSMAVFTAGLEKLASCMMRLTEGSSRMETTSCSSSTLTARSGGCYWSGQPQRWWAWACLRATEDGRMGGGRGRWRSRAQGLISDPG